MVIKSTVVWHTGLDLILLKKVKDMKNVASFSRPIYLDDDDDPSCNETNCNDRAIMSYHEGKNVSWKTYIARKSVSRKT